MEEFILKINIKWFDIKLWKVPERSIPVEWEWLLDFVKEIFINKIPEDNPLLIKDAFNAILLTFFEKNKLEDIVLMKEVDNEYKFSFDLWGEIQSDVVFSIEKKGNEDISINDAINQLLIQNKDDDEMMIYLSLLVFSWMKIKDFQNNMDEWLKKWYARFIDKLEVSMEKWK